MMELYIHLPFCRQKCRYCDFASFSGKECEMEAYVSALLREAELRREEAVSPIETAYFGGGTPSLLPPPLLKRLIHGLQAILPMKQIREWTVEANPGTLTMGWLEAAQDLEINRLSLGMQASQDRLLRQLGRIHQSKETEIAVSMARKAGFSNVNLDLIFGLPNQNLQDWQDTLDAAFFLHPEHLSAYGLIPEEGTPLWDDLQSRRLQLPEPEEEREMYEILLREAARHGMNQYEISNFAITGFECQHNIGYWIQRPYMGLGLSAASMLHISRDHHGISYLRRTNTSSWTDYMNGILQNQPVYSEEQWISGSEARFETMMLRLRMNCGIREDDFYSLHGVTMEECYGAKLEKLRQAGLLEHELHSWKLTRKGMDLQNTALVELMND